MITASSSTIAQDQKEELDPESVQEFRFTIATGNIGESHIQDPLLDNHAAASERATAEFLKTGYQERGVSFDTYRTDFSINEEVNVKGLWYKIKSINPSFNEVSGSVTIGAVRYE